jgi:hypothetical protein
MGRAQSLRGQKSSGGLDVAPGINRPDSLVSALEQAGLK